MNVLIRFTMVMLIALLLTSCVKTVEVPQPPASNPLTGSWIITDAAENDGSGWYPFDPAVDGIFTFYGDGGAEYDDGYSLMQGSWNSYTQTGGYYDQYGNYYTDAHQTFQVQTDGTSGGSLDLYFDDISFINRNLFVGTYYNGKGVEKYTFNRY